MKKLPFFLGIQRHRSAASFVHFFRQTPINVIVRQRLICNEKQSGRVRKKNEIDGKVPPNAVFGLLATLRVLVSSFDLLA